MRTAKDHLAADGVFAMYNYYRPFVFQRYAGTLRTVFGHAPCFDQRPGLDRPAEQAVLTIGVDREDIVVSHAVADGGGRARAGDRRPPVPVSARAERSPPTSVIALGLILLASCSVVRTRPGGRSGDASLPRPVLHGRGVPAAGDEERGAVRAAVRDHVVRERPGVRRHPPRGAARRGDRSACPSPPTASSTRRSRSRSASPGWCLRRRYSPSRDLRGCWRPSRLAFLPVFLANLIFAERFRDTARSTVAFGANLLGAMLGGVLEYGALVVGYRNLLFAVAVLYGLAFALRPRDAGAQRTDGARAVPATVA